MKQKLLNLKSLLLLLLMTVSMGARAQEIQTFESISDLRKADITEPTVVNVKISGGINSIEKTENGYLVQLENATSRITFSISAPADSELKWEQYGKVMGKQENVKWNPNDNSLTSETDIWSSLEYTAPPTYDSLQELLKAQSKEHVTVNNVNDVIESCAETSPGTGNYMVQLRNSDIFMTIIDKDLN